MFLQEGAKANPDFTHQNIAHWCDKPVIDTSNHYPLLRDSRIPELEISHLPESAWVQQHLGRPVEKVFNNIRAEHLQDKGQPAGTPGRIALPVAGDNAAAKLQVMALVEELRFDAVDDGCPAPLPTAPTCRPISRASNWPASAPSAPKPGTRSFWLTTPGRSKL